MALSLPPLLISLIQEGRWRQPSDEVIRAVIPVLPGPVDFILNEEAIRRDDIPLRRLRSERFLQTFRIARSLPRSPAPDLPWLDVDLALFIADQRRIGDEIAVALDYRSNPLDPRVVASDWRWTDRWSCYWCEVSPSFSVFVDRLGI
jgi:hypothetical protein